ncbi:MAG: hypothetical protein JWN70_6514 [Planctomycetaceae bacterium]|nr:hypothetical protein [Planctomycetaceae bacterium]
MGHAVKRIILWLSTLAGSWMGMQAVHEFGHVLGAWVTGGRVARVVLHPLTISRTDLADNPSPLIVVWAGPLVGCLLPLFVWGAAARCGWRWSFLLRFFAGFCLVANGAYIAAGSFDRVGDCGEMLRHGSAMWQLWLFGIVTVPTGFRLWHGLGKEFSLSRKTLPH